MGRNGPIKERKMRKVLVFIATTMLLSACGPAKPTAEQIATADYGSVPKKDPQSIVREYVNKDEGFLYLHDYPGTLSYARWSGLHKGWVQMYEGSYGTVYYGYRGCVYINYKKYTRHGDDVYSGRQPYIYVIKNDNVVYMTGGWSFRSPQDESITKQCDSLYQADNDAIKAKTVKTNASPEPVPPQKQANLPEQPVNPKPLPIRVGE